MRPGEFGRLKCASRVKTRKQNLWLTYLPDCSWQLARREMPRLSSDPSQAQARKCVWHHARTSCRRNATRKGAAECLAPTCTQSTAVRKADGRLHKKQSESTVLNHILCKSNLSPEVMICTVEMFPTCFGTGLEAFHATRCDIVTADSAKPGQHWYNGTCELAPRQLQGLASLGNLLPPKPGSANLSFHAYQKIRELSI